jgi:5-methylcytosine-specific restriction endonuclease McrA
MTTARQARVCRNCGRSGDAGALFSVNEKPHRCDDCLNTPWSRSRLYRDSSPWRSRQPQVADLTIGDWLDLLAEHEYRCAYCGRHALERPLGRDHVVPIALGGDHTKANVVPACKRCNEKKGRKPPTGPWVPRRPGEGQGTLPLWPSP